jgi:tRNA (Thr-GGU) A37 N-methylase
MDLTLKAIGFVRGGRTEVVDDDWDAVQAEIVLDPEHFTAEALTGLETFSHVEVLFHFHKGDPDKIVTGTRHPRGREDWPKVGIFAQRVEGSKLRVEGLDAIDGTPVLDIKPVLTGFAPRGTVREPDWAVEIMAEYW